MRFPIGRDSSVVEAVRVQQSNRRCSSSLHWASWREPPSASVCVQAILPARKSQARKSARLSWVISAATRKGTPSEFCHTYREYRPPAGTAFFGSANSGPAGSWRRLLAAVKAQRPLMIAPIVVRGRLGSRRWPAGSKTETARCADGRPAAAPIAESRGQGPATEAAEHRGGAPAERCGLCRATAGR